MKSFLGLARGKYDEVERKNLGNDLKNETVGSGANIRGSVQISSASKIKRVEAGGGVAWINIDNIDSRTVKTRDGSPEKTSDSIRTKTINPNVLFLKKMGKAGLDVLGKAGTYGKMGSLPIELLKMIVDGDGLTWKDIGSTIKGMGNTIIGMGDEYYKTGGKWPISTADIKALAGLGKYKNIVSSDAGWFKRLKNSGSSFVETIKEELSPVSKETLADNTREANNFKTGTKVAGWVLTLIGNGFSNYDEFGGLTGRMAAETITETVIDIGKGAAITAGVAAGCTLIGVAAPAVVVGGIGVGASLLADSVCENLTGKSVKEFTSDAVLDNALKLGKRITSSAAYANNVVSGWFEKAVNLGNFTNVQYSGAG